MSLDSVANASKVDQQKNKRSFSGSVTNLMKEKFTAHISKEDYVSFFNLCASLPSYMLKSEFERQTQNKYTTTRDEEIHNKDLRNIMKLVEDNPDLTMEEAATSIMMYKGREHKQ